MRTIAAMVIGFGVLAVAAPSRAGDRHWQTGTWKDVGVARQMLDFGPGSSGVGGGRGPTLGMQAMADVRTYVIETDELRLEL